MLVKLSRLAGLYDLFPEKARGLCMSRPPCNEACMESCRETFSLGNPEPIRRVEMENHQTQSALLAAALYILLDLELRVAR